MRLPLRLTAVSLAVSVAFSGLGGGGPEAVAAEFSPADADGEAPTTSGAAPAFDPPASAELVVPESYSRPAPGVEAFDVLSAPPEVRLPAVGVAEVEVGEQARAAGALPVAVSARGVEGVAPGRVRVEALDRGVAAQLGARFLAFRVDRADQVAARGRVEVEVDYSGFRHAYGADFDTRLQLVRFPSCVLERPEDPGCSTPEILPVRNDVGRGVLIAELVAGPDPVAVGASVVEAPVGEAGVAETSGDAESGDGAMSDDAESGDGATSESGDGTMSDDAGSGDGATSGDAVAADGAASGEVAEGGDVGGAEPAEAQAVAGDGELSGGGVVGPEELVPTDPVQAGEVAETAEGGSGVSVVDGEVGAGSEEGGVGELEGGEVVEADPGAGAGESASELSKASGGGFVYALTSGVSGTAGSFAATPLAPSGKWQVGLSSGNFSWEYPIPVPSASVGAAPSLSLAYSSQAVDGMTAASNTQPGVVGMGWDVAGLGSIERRYRSCADDGGSSGDLCWYSHNATISLNGVSTELVRDDATGVWRLMDDPAWRVELKSGAQNGDNDGEYWVVTTPDGVEYWFGYGKERVGSGDATGSAWTVPVYGNHAGEPCNGGSGWCQQAWRWNLDRVVDTHGNQTVVFWAAETNYYKRGGSGGTVTQYVRGGYPEHVEYSMDANFPASEWAPAHVFFMADNRCVEALNGGTCPWPAPGTEASWPDVPVDLVCGSSSCSNTSPSFFTWKRLTGIVTYTYAGGVWHAGDHVKLTHAFPSSPDGSSDPKLWLTEIERTGEPTTALPPSSPHDGRSSVTLPSVTLWGTWLANRADYDWDVGVTPFKLPRIAAILDEMGGQVTVSYGQPHPCVDMEPPWDWDTNGQDCFPVSFKPDGQPTAGWAIHNKWLVTSVTQQDNTGASPSQTFTYSYLFPPSWHHDLDPVTPTANQSWSDWRGHWIVEVETGSSTVTRTQYRFYRGMHGDRNANGTTKTVNLVDSRGGVRTDHNWLAGRAFQTVSYDAVGNELKTDLHDHWVSQTASQSTANYGPRVARMVRDDHVQTFTKKGSADLETNVETTFNGYGLPSSVYDRGRIDLADDNRCTVLNYFPNVDEWILETVWRKELHDGDCSAANPAKTDYYFDGAHSYEYPPTAGDVTRTRATTGAVWLNSYATFDAYGRITSTTNPRGYVTTTSYSPSTSRLTESVTATNSAGHQTVTVLDPVRLQPQTVQDPNGRSTRYWYDGLGRLASVQLPSESGSERSYTFSYTVNRTDPPVVKTSRLQESGVRLDSWALHDGFGRVREVQTPAPSGNGRTVVATRYNERGQRSRESLPFNATGTAGSGLVYTWSPPTEHRFTYDTVGRLLEDATYADGALQWATTTTYDGDEYVAITPESRRTRYRVDLDGNVTAVFERTTSGGSWAETYYEYNAAGLLTRVTDDDGNVSTNTYDLLGRRTAMDDPDMGDWSYEYDANGNLTRTTDAQNNAVVVEYDRLDRPTERIEDDHRYDPVTVARWSYDQAGELGLLRSSTSYDDAGQAYTKTIDEYSARGLPKHVVWTIPGFASDAADGKWEFSTSYDRADHVVSQTYPSGGGLPAETVTSDYTDLGFADTLIGINYYVSDTTYDGASRLAGRDLGTSTYTVARSYQYSGAGRLYRLRAVVDGGEIQSDWYSYDKDGNIVRIQEDANGSQRQCFAYDHRARLDYAWTTADGGCSDHDDPDEHGVQNYFVDYSYDRIGNITAMKRAGTTYTYSYPAAGSTRPHAVTSISGGGTTTGYAYNGNGKRRTVDGTTLSWTIWGPLKEHGATSFVYDADGNRILRTEPDGTTLTLEGHEIHRAPDGTRTGVRYYQLAGTTVAVRDNTDPASPPEGIVSWILGNHQGSVMTLVERGTTNVTRRRYLPHGAPRATVPDAMPERGFLGKTEDDSTGLVHLGARYYDPQIAQFISVDPLANPKNPQSLNGYTYSLNNPVTYSDPTGLWPSLPSWDDVKDFGGGLWDGTVGAAVETVNTVVDVVQCAGGECGDLRERVDAIAYMVTNPREAIDAIVADCTGNIAHCIGEAVGGLALSATGAGAAAKVADLTKATKVAKVTRTVARRADGACSFGGSTLVVMADGSRKPIDEIRVGDQVLATDPETGETESREVTHVWVHDDTVVDLVVDGDVVTTTEDHPFWNETDGAWQRADRLDEGDHLRAADGDVLEVDGFNRASARRATAYNLTVDALHTYYIAVGPDSALVHNTCGIARNKANGDAARDRIAARFPGSETEVFTGTKLGGRRHDVLTPDNIAIESKVGRAGLTASNRRQIAKDVAWRAEARQRSVEWHFSPSPITGLIGPTASLQRALDDAKIVWRRLL